MFRLNKETDEVSLPKPIPEITAVNDLRGKAATDVARYSITGAPVGRDYRRVAIIVMSDGTARKAVNN